MHKMPRCQIVPLADHHKVLGIDFWGNASGAVIRQLQWLAYDDHTHLLSTIIRINIAPSSFNLIASPKPSKNWRHAIKPNSVRTAAAKS